MALNDLGVVAGPTAQWHTGGTGELAFYCRIIHTRQRLHCDGAGIAREDSIAGGLSP